MLKRIRIPLCVLLVQVILLLALSTASLAAAKEGLTLSDLPPATQASISAVIGHDDADYHLQKTAAGFKAVNSGQRLAAAFSGDGATISNGTDSWSLTLAAFGRENDLRLVSPAVVTSDANRLEYRRDNLTEWYVNGPVGLEQGFTIPSRPSGPAEEMLVISMTGSGLKPLAAGAGSLSLVRADGSEAFRYGGLAAWDAAGKALPVQLALVGDQVQLKVDDRTARYPVAVDPFIQASSRLNLNADSLNDDGFGSYVALSSDGNTALVGAYYKNLIGIAQGAAYVLERIGMIWIVQARLTAADAVAAYERFGSSVALTSDGSTALVGAIGKDQGKGAAYVFIRSGASWNQQTRLTAADAAIGDYFGSSVALSSDGSTALVGASGKDQEKGSAYVFIFSGTTWSQQARLTDTAGALSDYFGASVALSSDGSTALIGAYGKTIGANSYQGAAYAFTRSGTTWNQQALLTAADGAANDNFGYPVALSSDGNTALIGANNKTIGGNAVQGAAYTFTRSGSIWSQQARLTAADGAAGDRFGAAVALSSDGNTALVGAYEKASGTYTPEGAAYAFSRSGTIWSQQARLTASDSAPGDNFGVAVALSSDGNTALVGAYGKYIGGVFSGAAYAFSRTGTNWSQQAELTSNEGAANDYFGISVAVSGDGRTALIGAHRKTIGANSQQGAVYIFTRSGTTWGLQNRLTASDGTTGDNFGVAVALSSDGSTALIGAYGKTIGANSQQGAAYAFTYSGSSWSQQARLTAADGATNDRFGVSVALSSDGSTAMVGAFKTTIGANAAQGAVYAFTRLGDSWDQQARLTASDGAVSDFFGYSVALSGDGNTALVGAYYKNYGDGAAYVFTRSGSTWSQQARLIDNDGFQYDYFGVAVALSGDGNTALVGAYNRTIGVNSGQGAAYAFTRSGTTWNQQARLSSDDGAVSDNFGSSVALSADGMTALVGAPNKTIGANSVQGAAYTFTRTGSTWNQQARLTADDGASSDNFGISVVLSGDGITALIGAYSKTIGYNTLQGAAYAFEIYPQHCSAGSYDNGLSCTPCAAGSYQNTSLQKSCFTAPVGSFVPLTGATQPTPCLPGFYQDLTGQTSCKACPAGSHQPSPGQSTCRPAPAGYYVASVGSVPATPCPAGSYQDLTGQTSCKACPAGSYQSSPGQTSCMQAPPGYYVPSPAAFYPLPCASGTAQESPGASSCTPCAAGTLQPATGQAACVAIPKAVNSVAFDPANLQNLFAGIDAAGIYIGANGGTIWIPATTQPTNNRIKALVLKPGDPTIQFAATYGGGVFTSADSGFNWTACANTNLTNLNVVSLAIADNGTLYAGTEAGIFTSADNCATWTAMNNGLPN